MEVKIAGRLIGQSKQPFIIAEMSGNHNQSLQRALDIVDAAAHAGVDAIKLQTYTADTITMDAVYTIQDPESLWRGKDLYQLYQEAYTPWEWHAEIFAHAQKRGLIAFSSPFDESAVDFLESLNVPAYKIASFENTHHPLLIKVAQTGKPVILSTGVASLEDIQTAVDVLRKAGCKELILLKCTSNYPADPLHSNLLTLPDMRSRFGVEVGLSDHTTGIGVAIAAVALGACVIEKHFTLSRSDGGVDAAFSMEPEEMQTLVTEAKRAWTGLGRISYELSDSEKKNLIFKRSIYVAADIQKGETLTEFNTKIIRPADGLEPRYYQKILGQKANKTLKMGQPLHAEDLDLNL
ncbi:MAG: pseudaminic acid synthase [Candidatus Sericytochromatia bacterium]|nr:pseudaminic acid synthase [Candidatus Sericytochromatia bacterium]